jgi:hypothetical protein
LLVSFPLEDPSFADASDIGGGVVRMSAEGVPIGGVGLGDGTAATYRIRDKDGTIRAEGEAGGLGSGKEAILSDADIETDQVVNLLFLRVEIMAEASE